MRRPASGPAAPAWWQRGAIYQVYPRSFADGDGDGVGDLRGLAARLDHLSALRVEAVWLSPIFPSPMADFGYDVADYCDVDPLFGTLADLDRLVEDCHERGIRVVLDWVPNHTSDRHPWFEASRSSRDDPRRDWYVWRDGVDGGPPNDWMSAFEACGPAWTFDERTGQWYLHSFMPEQPDLNWDNPEVEAAMHDVLRFWLDRGIDGFRLDAIVKIAKDPLLRDNGAGALRHHENWGASTTACAGSAGSSTSTGTGDRRRGRLPGRARPGLLPQHRRPAAHGAQLPVRGAALEPGGVRGVDRGLRGARRAGRLARLVPLQSRHAAGGEPLRRPARARALLLVLYALRGTPFIYQGEELGLPDAVVPPERVVDVDGRDPERAPIPWRPPSEAGPGAGFTDGEPWLPLVADAETLCVERQAADPRSTLALARRLAALRAEEPALQGGDQRPLELGPSVLAWSRGGAFVAAVNFAAEPVAVALPAGAELLLSTDAERAPGGPVEMLGPSEGVLLRLA